MAVRINSLFLLVVLWLSMKYCHYSNASETNELDPAMAGGMYVASKLLEKGALWWSVSGWEGANWNRWPVWICSLLLLCGDVELILGLIGETHVQCVAGQSLLTSMVSTVRCASIGITGIGSI